MPASYRRSVQCENYLPVNRDRVFFAHKTWGKITRLYVILNHGHGVRFSRIQRRCALLLRTRIVNAVRVDVNVWLQRQSPDLLHTTNRYMARWPLRHAVLPGFSHAIPHYFMFASSSLVPVERSFMIVSLSLVCRVPQRSVLLGPVLFTLYTSPTWLH